MAEDPLHCWLLEQAQSDGIIDVDAVYRTGQSLHIYLKQEHPLGEDVYRYLLVKAETREFECPTIPYTRGCGLGVFRYKEWWPSTLYILPMSQVYEDIRLLPGGADARRSETGWPSYRQLWPEVAKATGDNGENETYSFDLSEIDTTSFEFPPASCPSSQSRSCSIWKRWQFWSALNQKGWETPLDTAGWHGGHYNSQAWIQVPIGPDEGSEKLVEVEKVVRERHAAGLELILIPVKYGYKDMWHWAELLNRFARSSGNTIGIIQASVDWNLTWPLSETVFPLDSLQEASEYEDGGLDYNTVRDTIHLETLELQRTVEALPHLLGQLNIPVDAVGMVYRRDRSPVGPAEAAVQSDQQESSRTDASDETSKSTPDGAASAVGYCFGGALSGDPLHCWLLEEAQSEGSKHERLTY